MKATKRRFSNDFHFRAWLEHWPFRRIISWHSESEYWLRRIRKVPQMPLCTLKRITKDLKCLFGFELQKDLCTLFRKNWFLIQCFQVKAFFFSIFGLFATLSNNGLIFWFHGRIKAGGGLILWKNSNFRPVAGGEKFVEYRSSSSTSLPLTFEVNNFFAKV